MSFAARSASGTADQSGSARRALATAASTSSGVACGHLATTDSSAGLSTSNVPTTGAALPSMVSTYVAMSHLGSFLLMESAPKRGPSVSIRGVYAIHLPHQCIERRLTGLGLPAGCFEVRLRQYMRGEPSEPTGLCSGHLYVTGTLQQPQPHEGFLERLSPGQQTVIAQDNHSLIANTRDHSSLLIGVDRDTLEDVVGDSTVQLCTVERIVRQPLLQAGHGAPRRRMRVHDAVGRLDRSMYRAMGYEAGQVDRIVRGPHRPSLQIDCHQIRGRDLAVVQAERVDQKDQIGPGDAQGNVIKDQLRPAQVVENPIARGKPDTRLPLRIGNRQQPLTTAGRLLHEKPLGL